MNQKELKTFLDEKVSYFNQRKFIATDPIQIPHLFSKKEDIEISAFLTATIAWGNRKMIIKNAQKLMEIMHFEPYQFINEYSKPSMEVMIFKHRTFNGLDLHQIILFLQIIYKNYGGLETVFSQSNIGNLQERISHFHQLFQENLSDKRTLKHISNPAKGSAAKRINMFLRWMVRKDNAGVDFGLWSQIKMSELSCPLDLHSGKVARDLKLITRAQNDQKALAELDNTLRKFDPEDPVKYDFALFGLSAIENF